jgi:hypothetical protein
VQDVITREGGRIHEKMKRAEFRTGWTRHNSRKDGGAGFNET